MYATHPTSLRHLPGWFGALLGLMLGVLLLIAVLALANVVDLGTLFSVKPAEIPTTTQMLQQQFAIEHHEEIYGTTPDQLQRVFFLEHQVDMAR